MIVQIRLHVLGSVPAKIAKSTSIVALETEYGHKWDKNLKNDYTQGNGQ